LIKVTKLTFYAFFSSYLGTGR